MTMEEVVMTEDTQIELRALQEGLKETCPIEYNSQIYVCGKCSVCLDNGYVKPTGYSINHYICVLCCRRIGELKDICTTGITSKEGKPEWAHVDCLLKLPRKSAQIC